MKKLSLLMALAMLITIGGVYATWTYSEGTMQTTQTVDYTIEFAGVVSGNSKGEFTVDTSGLKAEIDNNNGDYVPVLNLSGNVVIHFKPATGASTDASQGKIDLMFKLGGTQAGSAITVKDTIKYEDKQTGTTDVFAVYDQTEQVVVTTTPVWSDVHQGWEYTIPASQLQPLIQLNPAAILQTYDEFTRYQAAVKSLSYNISVWEPTA